MASRLPSYVAIKSKYNNKYLHYIQQAGKMQRFLRFSGEMVVSPYVKYEVEVASSGHQGLVHIRCCYNNKYWVRESQTSYWIVAAADAPEEDKSKWSCTLFEPLFADDGSVQLRHVQLQHYACLWRAAAPHTDCLFAGASTPDKDKCDVFTIFDWNTLVILPKHIAFKGDNGKYLKSFWHNHEYLQFKSDDVGDPFVRQQVFYTQDGHVRIMANHYSKLWRLSAGWIWSDTPDTTSNNLDILFWPVKVDENVIALRNSSNKNFCMRLTADDKTDCLNAALPTITKEARLEIEELLISRSIYNVNFRLADARIYSQHVLTLATRVAINATLEPSTVDLKLSHIETTSSAWNSSASSKLGVKISFSTGIPLIYEGKIKLSSEFNGTYQWGQTRPTENVVETTYKVIVPPMTIVNVALLATQGTCDVPFSYTQRDVQTNGQHAIYYLDDGVYTGINCYNFKFEAKQEALPANFKFAAMQEALPAPA